MFGGRIKLQALRILDVVVDILVDIVLDKTGSVSIAWMVEVVIYWFGRYRYVWIN